MGADVSSSALGGRNEINTLCDAWFQIYAGQKCGLTWQHTIIKSTMAEFPKLCFSTNVEHNIDLITHDYFLFNCAIHTRLLQTFRKKWKYKRANRQRLPSWSKNLLRRTTNESVNGADNFIKCLNRTFFVCGRTILTFRSTPNRLDDQNSQH